MKIFNFFIALFLLFSSCAFAANVSVTFILDESGSVSSSEFQLETQGFVNALNSLPADGSIEVSIIGFASGLTVIQDVTVLTASTYDTIRDALSNNPKSGGSTYMGNAISQASTLLSASSAQTKIIFLATDGRPTNESNARIQAINAKNDGIVLTPIGIGLGSSGKTFLDSIASNPPVANPSDFNEFATVVRNIILGGVSSSAGLELTPEIVSFGSYTPSMLVGLVKQKTIILDNKSSEAIALTSLAIEGVDADQFSIDSIAGKPFSLPLDFSAIPPKTCTTMIVSFRPNMSKDSFDASLVVIGVSDGEDVSTTATLSAKSGSGVTASMDVAIFDAIAIDKNGKQLIDTIKSNLYSGSQIVVKKGYYSGGEPVEEPRIKKFNEVEEWKRIGLVADGNARVLVRVQTDQSGEVEFRLDSAKTNSRFENFTMTKSGSTIKIATEDVGGGIYQATAVLVAEERFSGEENEPTITFDIDIDLLDSSGTSLTHEDEKMNVRRAPVVLIHGLWADKNSWEDDWRHDEDNVMAPQLRAKHFNVGFYKYNGSHGPSQEMQPENSILSGKISELCEDLQNEKYACTRADLVGHSMGGLVSREFIRSNNNYRNDLNFHQGAVRRMITLGTPHFGSGFANLLSFDDSDDSEIGNCVLDRDALLDLVAVVRYKNGDDAIDSAITDLAIGSTFLTTLNEHRQNINSYGVFGDVGTNLVLWDWAIERTGCDHGELFQGNNSDGVVSVVSAQGNYRVTTRVTGAGHLGMGKNGAITIETIRLLNADLSDYSQQAKLYFPKHAPALHAYASEKKEISFAKIISRIFSPFVELFTVQEAHAASASVTLTVNNQNPSPGDIITFEASTTGHDIPVVMLTDNGSLHLNDNSSPYQWTFNLPKDASGQVTFKAISIIDSTAVESNIITITIKPDLNNLQQLSFDPGYTKVLRPGSSEQLILVGLFNDGYNRNLTQAAMETVYSEAIVDGLKVTPGDSPAISVSNDGMVTAIKEGTADVIATNNGVTTSRRIIVKKGTWKEYFAEKFPWLMFIPAFINGK